MNIDKDKLPSSLPEAFEEPDTDLEVFFLSK